MMKVVQWLLKKTCKKTETSGSYHCLLIDDGNISKCKRINLDTNCEFDSNGICKARSIETGYKCKMGSDGKECSKQQIVCSDYNDNCNQYGENCVKIKVSSEGISFNQIQNVKKITMEIAKAKQAEDQKNFMRNVNLIRYILNANL